MELKKEKIFLTSQEIEERKVLMLIAKYGVHRSTIFRALKNGWFWQNCQVIQQSLSPHWVEKNMAEITEAVKFAVNYKARQKGFIHHRLFNEYKEDLFQEGFLYVVLRAGEIESGKSKLRNIAKTGIDHSILKFFFYGDGGHTVQPLDFWEDKSNLFADSSLDENDEINLDDFFVKIKELISSISEEYWQEVWNWALSRKTKCPDNVRTILMEVAL